MYLTPEKRNSLAKLGAGTLAGLLAIWFLLINPARQGVDAKVKQQAELAHKISLKSNIIETAEQISARLKESAEKLDAIEKQMVSGDPYLWIIRTLGEFESPDEMEFTKYDPPKPVDTGVSDKIPYRLLSFTVTGVAAYHDLGSFLAAFENRYPHVNIHSLEMEPVPGADARPEQLHFQIEIHVPVKPTRTGPGTALTRS